MGIDEKCKTDHKDSKKSSQFRNVESQVKKHNVTDPHDLEDVEGSLHTKSYSPDMNKSFALGYLFNCMLGRTQGRRYYWSKKIGKRLILTCINARNIGQYRKDNIKRQHRTVHAALPAKVAFPTGMRLEVTCLQD